MKNTCTKRDGAMNHARRGKSLEPALLAAALIAFGFVWLQPEFMARAKNLACGVTLIIAAHCVYFVIVGILLSRGVKQLIKLSDRIAGAFLFSLSLYLSIINAVMMIFEICS